MTTIALDEDNWDIFVSNDGCMAVVDGCEEIIQCIRQKIYTLDITSFLKNNTSPEAVTALIKSKILEVDGVISLSSFSTSVDDTNCNVIKGIRVNFQAITECGIIRSQL